MPVSSRRLLPRRLLRSRSGEMLCHHDPTGTCGGESSTFSIADTAKSKRHTTTSPETTTTKTTTALAEPKHVTFSSIEFRLYQVVLGDHPCCHSGCPLTLGWQYSPGPSFSSIEAYEAHRSGGAPDRRTLHTTTCDERHHRLLETQTLGELRRASRMQQRHRDRRIQKAEQQVFFHPARDDEADV